MRKLFEINARGCFSDEKEISAQSVRAIIVSYGRIAMFKSGSDDIYKFPGGEIRDGEDTLTALVRRLRENMGLIVVPNSETEFGYVLCRERTETGSQIVQRIFYYLCRIEPFRVPVVPSSFCRERVDVLDFVSAVTAIEVNRLSLCLTEPTSMLESDICILKLLSESGMT